MEAYQIDAAVVVGPDWAMLDSATRTHRDLKETAVICCGPEADLAHKIQEQMDNKRDMLVANLKAMW